MQEKVLAPRRVLMPLIAVLAWAVAGVTTAAEVLNVTGSRWSPYLDADLPEGGLAADIVRTALTRAGYEIRPNIEPWERAYQGTAVGVYDVVAAIWQSPEREQELLFSEPYLLNDVIFIGRRGKLIDYETLSDLAGLRIGVVRGYAYEPRFDSHPDLIRVANGHLVQNLLLLRQGKLDLVVGDKWSILHEISEFLPGDVDRFTLLARPLARRALRLGVSRENPRAAEIVADFDGAIAAMREDGTFDAIVRRHTEGIARLPGSR
jgi:polar amino acid transport system substrate-binding protein